MKRLYVVSVGALASAILFAWLLPASTAAQDPAPKTANTWTPSRTPWGDPDLQGVWRYEATMPLERPRELAGKATLTDEEVARRDALEKEQEAKRLAGEDGVDVGRQPLSQSPIRGNEYNSFWQDHGRPRKVYNRTSLIVDPPDGRLPFTADAQKAAARSAARYGV